MNRLERWHLHRGLGIVLVYLFLLVVVADIGYLAVPLTISETQRLMQQLPTDLQHLAAPLRRLGITLPVNPRSWSLATLLTTSQHVTEVVTQALTVATTLGQGAVALLSVVVMVPNIYGRAVHLHPVLVIVALLIGGATFGQIGALVAVPLAAALHVGIEELYLKDVAPPPEHPRSWRGWRWSLLSRSWHTRARPLSPQRQHDGRE